MIVATLVVSYTCSVASSGAKDTKASRHAAATVLLKVTTTRDRQHNFQRRNGPRVRAYVTPARRAAPVARSPLPPSRVGGLTRAGGAERPVSK